jgi:uncharacterized membrane protein YeaQ/YmgE (transglycosylase-associated protein family)
LCDSAAALLLLRPLPEIEIESKLMDDEAVSQPAKPQGVRCAVSSAQMSVTVPSYERRGSVLPAHPRGIHAYQSRGRAAMGIIAFIVLGLLAGAIAKAIMPGDDPGGWIITAVIGVVGAILGGFLAGALFGADPMDEFFDISSWLTAIVGSIILLALYRVVVNRGGGHRALRT